MSQCFVEGGEVEVAKLDDRIWHETRALVIGEVVLIREKVKDDVGGGRDDEVVVVDKDDEGDEEWVNGVFINKI